MSRHMSHLSEMTPSALNKTAFPQNSRKRLLHSPNSPNNEKNNGKNGLKGNGTAGKDSRRNNNDNNVAEYDDDDDDDNEVCYSRNKGKNKVGVKMQNRMFSMAGPVDSVADTERYSSDFEYNSEIDNENNNNNSSSDSRNSREGVYACSTPVYSSVINKSKNRSGNRLPRGESHHQHSNSQSDTDYYPRLSKTSSQSSSIAGHQRVSLRRSTGLLNLSLEASPSTQRVINTSSKNDEMLKSFNELTFDSSASTCDVAASATATSSAPITTSGASTANVNNIPNEKPVSEPSGVSDLSLSTQFTRSKMNYKPTRVKYSSIFGTHNIASNNHTCTNRRGSDMQKKLERQLEHYKDKISNTTTSNFDGHIQLENTSASPNVKVQSSKKTKLFTLNKFINNNTPFKSKSKIPTDLNLDHDLDLMLDDTSPSKHAYNKPASSSNGNNTALSISMPMASSSSLSNRPITTGSLANNYMNSTPMSASSSVQTNGSNSMMPPSTLPASLSDTNKNINTFTEPSTFSSVKPLQTAFNSTGLQSKNGLTTFRRAKHTVPETPCKKPPRVVEIDKLRSSHQISGSTSAPATATATAHTTSNQTISSTPLSDNSSFNSTANETSYIKNLSNITNNTTVSRHNLSGYKHPGPFTSNQYNHQSHQTPAINTSDLQQCLLKFTNEFDDLYNEGNANISIFTDHQDTAGSDHSKIGLLKKMNDLISDDENENNHHDDDDDIKMWDESEKIPSTPREKSNMAINLSSVKSIKDNSNMNTPESLNSVGSVGSNSSGKLNDTPTRRIGYYNKFNNFIANDNNNSNNINNKITIIIITTLVTPIWQAVEVVIGNEQTQEILRSSR